MSDETVQEIFLDDKNKSLLYHKKQSELNLSPEALLTLAQAVLNKGMPFRFRAGGFSMLPFIRDGDVITISPAKNTHISTGDVVAVLHPSDRKVFIHRVVKKVNGLYLVKGDNCPEPDGIFSHKNILGKITKVERRRRKKVFGNGPERFIIAVFSRNRHLFTVLNGARKVVYCIKVKTRLL